MNPAFRRERGLLWPALDRGAAAVVFDTSDLDLAIAHCRARNVVVQAGGNCGVWPLALAAKFAQVYTFEPDALNFRCMSANVSALNVHMFQAALGEHRGCIDLERRAENVGAHQVAGLGPIPTIRIDDLALPACDLLYLDIEGSELAALHGAERTIAAHRPVIAVEDKGMSTRYGVPQGAIETWLAEQFGYRVVARPHRDVILVPA